MRPLAEFRCAHTKALSGSHTGLSALRVQTSQEIKRSASRREHRMARARSAGVSYEAVKAAALALPEVEESTSYGTPALKVRGKLMVRLREDFETIVVRATWEDRERLMAVDPETYYVTDHYLKHPWVLARVSPNSSQVRSRRSCGWPGTMLRQNRFLLSSAPSTMCSSRPPGCCFLVTEPSRAAAA